MFLRKVQGRRVVAEVDNSGNDFIIGRVRLESFEKMISMNESNKDF